MRLPKQRLTIDLDHRLLAWVMDEAVSKKLSRNEVIGRCIEGEIKRRAALQPSETRTELPGRP